MSRIIQSKLLKMAAGFLVLQTLLIMLFPAAALLSGWGLLTVWRLDSGFGARQALWLGVSLLVFSFGLGLPITLGFLRRYKYLLLSTGLILPGLSLLFGTNPTGFGPRLWLLGCGGVFL